MTYIEKYVIIDTTKGDEDIAEQQKPKRKTYTSSEVKNRYNKKTYTNIVLSLHKEKAEAYKAKCKEKNIPYSELLRKAVDDFLNSDENK